MCLVEISGDGCASCVALMPEVKEAAKNLNLRALRIDAGDCGKLLEEWGIERLPATVLEKDGKPIAKCYGYQPQEILELWAADKLGLPE